MYSHKLFATETEMAVHAPWPKTEPEDKVLTREAKFLRDSIKIYRQQHSKAKKGWTKAAILVTDSFSSKTIYSLSHLAHFSTTFIIFR